LMGEGGDQFVGSHIPKLGGFVSARCQDPSAVRTKCRMIDPILMNAAVLTSS
jgi:hypothetical protein